MTNRAHMYEKIYSMARSIAVETQPHPQHAWSFPRLYPRMMKKITYLLLAIHILLIASATAQLNQASEAKIEAWLYQMTLSEKVAMCHAQSKFSSPGVSRLGIPEIWMSDGPHGVRAEFEWDSWNYANWTNDECTAFPALTCLASTFNPQLSHAYGFAVGEEARYREKDILLGPGVNIYRTPLNGRNFEYMGEDPCLASTMVVPYIKGVQRNGVAACVKHFALNNQEKWRNEINVNISDRALYEIYLPAYKAAVQEAGVWSVMGAYNLYDGQYCCHNKRLLVDILKGDWQFDGVVISDWGGTMDTLEAALYGLDIEMGTGTNGLTYSEENAFDNYYLALAFEEKIREGEIPESYVDDKVRRILRTMMRTNLDRNRPLGRMMCDDHSLVAREVAREGIVLLKNKNSFLPLKDQAGLTIAVIGENATRPMTIGGGSSELKAAYEISPLLGIQKQFTKANIVHAMGYGSGPSTYGEVMPSPYDAEELKSEAIDLAGRADVVLFFGGLNKSYEQDCEGGDRTQFGLPFGQDELLRSILEVNPRVAVVLISGNAVAMPWVDEVQAIVQGWYLGSEAGHALADVISGETNPSGKLPFTFPVALEDNAAHHFGERSYPGDGKNQFYEEGIYVGYRWHQKQAIAPLFPFGFGLSYSTFEASDLKSDSELYGTSDTIALSCNIKNTGKTAGSEVVQIYVGKNDSSVDRAPRELKGFAKVRLEPNETREVAIAIPVQKLAYYDETMAGWQVEKGHYQLYLATDSETVVDTVEITVE
jgi:beta-glucosidase